MTPGDINRMNKQLQEWHDRVVATRASIHLTDAGRTVFTALETHLQCADTLSFAIGNDLERWG